MIVICEFFYNIDLIASINSIIKVYIKIKLIFYSIELDKIFLIKPYTIKYIIKYIMYMDEGNVNFLF